MSTRDRIVTTAAKLLAEGGSDAVSTRAVAAAAGVQAPTLYRLFGDKQGLLDAVATYGFDTYLATKKAQEPSDDPVADLARGWDNHTAFGLAYPAFYSLMFGGATPGRQPEAARTARSLLLALLGRIADAGRLRMPAEDAAAMIHAVNVGVVLSLITTPETERDLDLSARTRDIVLAAITTAAPDRRTGDLATRALALDAALDSAFDSDLDGRDTPLSGAETALLRDWLRRLAH